MKGLKMVDYSSYTDEQLVSLCRENCKDAWNELCLRYVSVTCAEAFKFKGCEIETEDLMQEGMFGFLSAVHSFNENGAASFKTYASTCIRNKIINAVKSARRKKQIPFNSRFSLEDDCNIADTAMSPEELVISKNTADQIFAAIYEKLSEKEAVVFKMYLLGDTYEKIAEKLSMSTKAVDGALQRARKKLRNSF
ncbi:MAG: sigma-70 family RNA polymerase sigma factor [Faecalibacterium sp.]|nr:sigma-70 family RNA polymerase sigma factor [Ruminococcus sp.]MCM1391511.1 sigma-70 family RNA polymerase sigma factor [Ruminococcus sp.]MCM1485875.1 sigma-70 family RNA polymerase sigma factor [Faecalibacterium sp.]